MNTVNNPKPRVLFVLGGPGSGKGTQCYKILEKYQYANFVHLSTGVLLRDATKNADTPANRQIQRLMKEGKMVSSQLLVNLIKSTILTSHQAHKNKMNCSTFQPTFIIDGFPRNKDNLQAWKAIIGDEFDIKFLLYIAVPEDNLRKRLLKRAETSGRADDNPETIEKRLKTFYLETKPMLQFFEKNNGVSVIVDGDKLVEGVARDVTIQLKKWKLI